MNPTLLDSAVKSIGQAYAFWDSLNISVTALLIGFAVVVFGFFFAARQAISWFLKIDDVKRDVARLRELILQVEGEIRVLQSMTPPPGNETGAVSQTAPVEPVAMAANQKPSFRINH